VGSVGEILKPRAHSEVTDWPGEDICQNDPFHEIKREQGDDARCRCAENLADANLFRFLLGRKRGQAKESKAGDEDGGWLLRLRKPTRTTVISSVALHEVLLGEGAGLTAEQQVERISYVKDATEALDGVRSGTAQAAFILAAPEVGQVRAAAAVGERLPPKTTYFWPKVPAGIAIHSIDTTETVDLVSGGG